jgi:RimJ/RimL family protein N-acetyltransferase
LTTSSEGNSEKLDIRPAALEDLDELLEIYLSSARHHVGLDPEHYREPVPEAAEERLRGIIEDNGRMSGYLAAAIEGRVVGSVSIVLLPPTSDGSMMAAVPTAEIGIAVLDDARDAGVGTALMAAAEEWAADRGVRVILLDMSSRNAAAQRFYERLGYQVSGLYLRKAIG